MDKNILKAIVACFLVMIIWNLYFGKPIPKDRAPLSPRQSEISSAPAAAANSVLKTEAPAAMTALKQVPKNLFEEKTIFLKTRVADIEISNRGGKIKKIFFKRYKNSLDFEQEAFLGPLAIVRAGNVLGVENQEFKLFPNDNSSEVTVQARISPELEVSSIISATEQDYLYRVKVAIKNLGQTELYLQDGIELGLGNLSLEKKKTFPVLTFSRFSIENKTENLDYKKVEGRQNIDEPFQWAGIQNTTYCALIRETEYLRRTGWNHLKGIDTIGASIATAEFNLSPGQEKIFTFNYYLGPKLYFHLKELNLSFENIINYGDYLGPITKPLVLFLNFLFKHIHNYGWAIIIMTIVIRLLTYPLNKKSILSMKEMQVIQPQMKRLQEQYKNDPKRMQQELMILYKKHGVNPMSGCFPMLIQIPVFFAFYKALASSVELEGAAFFFIKDLAAPDAIFSIPGMSYSVNILPILMGVTQLISQKQTMSDPSQKNLMYFFTIFLTFIFYSMPSGLVLYFLVSNLLSIWQTAKISKIKNRMAEQTPA